MGDAAPGKVSLWTKSDSRAQAMAPRGCHPYFGSRLGAPVLPTLSVSETRQLPREG